jgi:hypothetical protein
MAIYLRRILPPSVLEITSLVRPSDLKYHLAHLATATAPRLETKLRLAGAISLRGSLAAYILNRQVKPWLTLKRESALWGCSVLSRRKRDSTE